AGLQACVRNAAIARAKTYWKTGAHILDVGCGTGAFAIESTRMNWRVTGVDAALSMCAKNAVAVNAQAEHLPFADEVFDGVFSSLMLQWSNTPGGVFHEMSRVLKKGGVAVITTFIDGTLAELKQAFSAVDNASHVSDFLTQSSLERYAGASGFSLKAVEAETITEQHKNLRDLMRSLKVIGARHKAADKRRTLLTPRQLAKVEAAYPKTDAFPASWQVLYMVLEKA
ncbi:MAG: methyltransferase domain-containing protein, partial [Alphaproteobacteria bacterium]|nr:methyltransferase domain-containing protein [Alphaproteobacteria bacterium]